MSRFLSFSALFLKPGPGKHSSHRSMQPTCCSLLPGHQALLKTCSTIRFSGTEANNSNFNQAFHVAYPSFLFSHTTLSPRWLFQNLSSILRHSAFINTSYFLLTSYRLLLTITLRPQQSFSPLWS